MSCELPVTPQERRSASASAGRRPGRRSWRTPGIGWLAGLSSTRGTSREVMSSFDGAAAASARSRSSSSGRMAAQGSRWAIWSWRACLLICNLGGVEAMVGDEHALQAIEDEQPRTGLEMAEQQLAEFECLLFPEVFRAAGR